MHISEKPQLEKYRVSEVLDEREKSERIVITRIPAKTEIRIN